MQKIFRNLIDDNIENLSTFFDKQLKNIFNVDVALHKYIEIKIDDNKVKDLEKEKLFVHLLIIRTIAQVYINWYSNGSYFKDNTFNYSHLLEAIEDENDKRIYEDFFNAFCDIKDWTEDKFVAAVKESISNYLVVSKTLLLKEEESEDYSLNTAINDEKSKMNHRNIRTKQSNSESNFNAVTLCNLPWKCIYCDTENDNKLTKCSACEADREIAPLTPLDKTINSKIEENRSVFQERNLKSSKSMDNSFEYCDSSTSPNCGTLKVTDGQRSFVNSISFMSTRALCHRCNQCVINIMNSVICGDCANELFNKEKDLRQKNESSIMKNCKNEVINPLHEADSVKNNSIIPDTAIKCDNTDTTDECKCDEYKDMKLYDCDKCRRYGNYGPRYDTSRCGKYPMIDNELDGSHCNNQESNPLKSVFFSQPAADLSSRFIDNSITYDGNIQKIDSDPVIISEDDKPADKGDGNNSTIDKWWCSHCSLFNVFDIDKCAVCGSIGPHIDQWKCDQCTLLNLYANDQCSKCGNNGPHYDKWRCEQCTNINNKLDKVCIACDKVNAFIGICHYCHKNDINNKYDKYCDECITINIQKNNDITARTDQWSCNKCSYRNTFDQVQCKLYQANGPHVGKWKCDKCTFLNSRFETICSTCGTMTLHPHIYTIDSLQSINKSIYSHSNRDDANSDTKYRYMGNDKSCMKCSAAVSDISSNLCIECIDKYYVCNNKKCNYIYNIDSKYCDKCGIERFSTLFKCKPVNRCINGSVDRVWQCSYEKCLTLNKYEYSLPNNKYCSECGIPRFSTLSRTNIVERYIAGHLEKVWQCSYKECMTLNNERCTSCTECRCPKKNYNNYICYDCGWIKTDYYKCSKCND